MDMPLSMSFIDHAMEREFEAEAWGIWKSLYPFMVMGWMKWIGFSEYKAGLFSKQHVCSQKSDEEIEEEMGKVIDFYERKARRGGV